MSDSETFGQSTDHKRSRSASPEEEESRKRSCAEWESFPKGNDECEDRRSPEEVARLAGIKVVTTPSDEELKQSFFCGSGGYSVVYILTHKELKELGRVVYKKIVLNQPIDYDMDLTEEKKKDKKKKLFNREFQLHAGLKHDNIVKLVGAILNPESSLGMLMEVVDRGDLRKVQGIYRHYITWPFRVRLLLEAASGIEYLHQQTPPIIHGDLKSENLLVTKDFAVKLCDFGSAARQGVRYGRRMPFTFQYVPPEAWEQDQRL